ncbi:hypothetical protein MSPP1_002595 [Malassezia sp. CBS 17886]|nr:hypothetical protein MSPP1_002595 [Malassezia sp. CBS 17886]
MALAPGSLVPATAELEQARTAVLHACAQLQSAAPDDRSQGTRTLLAFAQSPAAVDQCSYILAHAADSSVQFHVLGALLAQLPSLLVVDASRQVDALPRLRDWLLQAAVVRVRAARDAPGAPGAPGMWPAHLRTRYLRAIVLLSKRAGGLHAHGDAAPILSLGTHIQSLLAYGVEEPMCAELGFQLTGVVADEVGRLGDTDAGDAAPRSSAGLSALEHLWCHALVQVHTLPALLPCALSTLCVVVEHVQQRPSDSALGALLASAVHAAGALLAWQYIATPPLLQSIDAAAWPPVRLLAHLREHLSAAMDAAPTPNAPHAVPRSLDGALLTPDLARLVAAAARAADVCDGALSLRTANAAPALLCRIAAFRPDAPPAGAWVAQRAAVLDELVAVAAAVCARMEQEGRVGFDDVHVLRQCAGCLQTLLAPGSVDALLQTAGSLETVVQVYARITDAAFHIAFVLLPRDALLADDPALATAADALVDDVLATWYASGARLATAAGEARAALQAHVRERVVLAYQSGRIHGAAACASGDASTDSDADMYDAQLVLYAVLARDALPDAAVALQAHLVPLQAALGTPHPPDAVWEQLHWAALLAGHLLADTPRGETGRVPDAIAHAPLHTVGEPVLALLRALSFDVLASLAARGPASAHPASPQVLATLLWFTARWVPSYLLRDDDDGNACAPVDRVLAGDAGRTALRSLVDTIRLVLAAWESDADVLGGVAELLTSFARSPGVLRELLQEDAAAGVFHETLGRLAVFPADACAPLLGALVRCLDAARDGAARARDAYYPAILAVVDARIAGTRAADAHVPEAAAAALAALTLVHALATTADTLVSPRVHEHLVAQLPAIAGMTHTLVANTEVLCAALQALRALVASLDEVMTPDAGHVLAHVARAVHHVLTSARHALGAEGTGCVATSGGGACGSSAAADEGDRAACEDVVVLYLGVVDALAALAAAVHVHGEDAVRAVSDAAGAIYDHDAGAVCAVSFARLTPVLEEQVLKLPCVREALTRTLAALLGACSGALLGSTLGADGGPPAAADGSHPARAEDMRLHPITAACARSPCAGNPLHVALRATSYLLCDADACNESPAVSLAQALGVLASRVRRAPPALVQAALVQYALDGATGDLVAALLVRPLHPPLLHPLLLALRALLVARMHSEVLGGEASLLASLQEHCVHVCPQASSPAETQRLRGLFSDALLALLLHARGSEAAPPVDAALPAHLRARALAHNERLLAARFCRDLAPLVTQTRSALLLR